jgi:solute:Na+ symporter, SSS family
MKLNLLDWTIIALYCAVNVSIGLYYYRKASGSVGEFFLSGRSVPWWLAGTSMVATTFGADTPLVVSALVYKYGIAGNWFWWSYALSGMLTVFFFARLWRRAGVLTDMEFAELRYGGRPAAFLRGFRALYLALPVNTIIMGWVNLAMVKILQLTLGLEKTQAIMVTLLIAALIVLYTTSSGLWSVLWTDVLQFVLKMGVVIALAVFAVHAVGGMEQLQARVVAQDPRGAAALAFVPRPGADWFLMFLVFLSINWWASWYPGSEPGGGGYVAQRIFSAKNEKHSLAATLWFNIAHFAVRPWPWILTALVAVVLYPHQKDPEVGYIQVMIDHLPAYLRGLMLAGFAAAYMSTMATHINLGASYLLNDFYRRFVKKDASEQHYVTASRIATIAVTMIAAVASLYLESIEGAWKFLIAIGAGAGLVFMLRWFWWRINAWSEIAAMVAAATSSLLLQSRLGTPVIGFFQRFDPLLPSGPLDAAHPHGFAWLMLLTTGFTTLVWLIVTIATPPESMEKLQSFYKLVQPASLGWKPVANSLGIQSKQNLGWAAADWIAGCGLIYFSLFGLGHLIFGHVTLGLLYLVGAAVCGGFIYWDLDRRGWETLTH